MAMITGALAVMLSGCSVPEDLEAVDPAATEAAEQSPEADVAEVTDEETEEQEEPAEAQDIKVVESAFGKTADSDTWWYVVILDNPNPDAVFTYESIDIEALDKEGTILDSSSDYSTILPGKFAVQGTFFDVADGKISELNVRGPDGSTAEHADEIGSFRIGKAKAKFDDWSTDVSGTVASSRATRRARSSTAISRTSTASPPVARRSTAPRSSVRTSRRTRPSRSTRHSDERARRATLNLVRRVSRQASGSSSP
jgi:hypothetical protein